MKSLIQLIVIIIIIIIKYLIILILILLVVLMITDIFVQSLLGSAHYHSILIHMIRVVQETSGKVQWWKLAHASVNHLW